jgi:predicted alpha-1,6-mannanase (GH76 family)
MNNNVSLEKKITQTSISPLQIGVQLAPISDQIRIDAIDAYIKAFYLPDKDGTGIFAKDSDRIEPDRLDFWREAEMIELLEDSIEQGSGRKYAPLLDSLYEGFIKLNGADWSWNLYNDDIIWITIACARAYKITGVTKFLERAKLAFNLVYDRALTPSIGGGLLWHMEKDSKHSCINGPAAIAGFLLYQAGAGEEYYKKGKKIFEWEYKTLFRSDGHVSDSIRPDGKLIEALYSYNSGTFIGAVDLLGQIEETAKYNDDALKAALYTKKHITGEIIPDIFCNRERDGDGPGFHSIFFRWCGKWANRIKNKEILSWFTLNAQEAAASQNSAGLMWGAWGEKTPEGPITSWEASNAVAVIQACP